MLRLSQPVNPQWIECFHQAGGSGLVDFLARNWVINGDVAQIQLPQFHMMGTGIAQQAFNQLTMHVQGANVLYVRRMEAQARQVREGNEQARIARIQDEERRQAILNELRGIT